MYIVSVLPLTPLFMYAYCYKLKQMDTNNMPGVVICKTNKPNIRLFQNVVHILKVPDITENFRNDHIKNMKYYKIIKSYMFPRYQMIKSNKALGKLL